MFYTKVLSPGSMYRRDHCRTVRRRLMTDTLTISVTRRVSPRFVLNYVLTCRGNCPCAYRPSSVLCTRRFKRVRGSVTNSIRMEKCCPKFTTECFRRRKVRLRILRRSGRVLGGNAISFFAVDCCSDDYIDIAGSKRGATKGKDSGLGGPCLGTSS